MLDAKAEVIREINIFVLSQTGISYYDVQNYAYKNDKQDWIAALKDKNTRRHISELCRSKRHKDGVPYRTFYGEPYQSQ